MGCFWSCEEGDADRCHHCNRKAVNDLVVINSECQICLDRARSSHTSSKLRLEFGNYKCSSCGRSWASRRSCRGRYLICKICGQRVYPHTQRPLRASDFSKDRENVQDHPQELCQLCIELGDYCGKPRFAKLYFR